MTTTKTKTKVTNAQMGLTVHELGEDGGQWLVLGTMDVRLAREAVIRWALDADPNDTAIADVVRDILEASDQPGWGWYFETSPSGDGIVRHSERAAEGSTAVSVGVAFGVPRIKHAGRPDLLPVARRTKRRFAHELYPHGGEMEVRPLAVDVPYLMARALGLNTWHTGWRLASSTEYSDRVHQLVEARMLAFVADALLQGMAGDKAWAWASEMGDEESGELLYDRAVHYGVEPGRIKPYPCGPIPQTHDHYSSTGDSSGHGTGARIEGPEEACEVCTEPLALADGDDGA
ncbi:hypothetical protein [Pseudoclavibacter helvolus]|uniref:hypothetical protein n=1 Tax=Pseudoclavibacter helvolus TaxID=255205 RepID=UPI003735BE60